MQTWCWLLIVDFKIAEIVCERGQMLTVQPSLYLFIFLPCKGNTTIFWSNLNGRTGDIQLQFLDSKLTQPQLSTSLDKNVLTRNIKGNSIQIQLAISNLTNLQHPHSTIDTNFCSSGQQPYITVAMKSG